MDHPFCCTAFEGFQCIASGDLEHVAIKTKEILDRGEHAPVLIFDDATSELVEIDFRGSVNDVQKRIAARIAKEAQSTDSASSNSKSQPGPGRPKLGVVAREVTLLPRHWDWLNRQPGGASVTLRKLVDEARRASDSKNRIRQSQDVTYRFMMAIAGNLPDFEEATRALFAGDRKRFERLIESWPVGVRDHSRKISSEAFGK